MKNPKRGDKNSGTAECILAPPALRLGVLVVITIVMGVLAAEGYDLSTTLAYAAGAGMTAGYVTQQLFGLPYRGRGAR